METNRKREQEAELDYYAAVLKKIRNKKYEFYVISRIFHRLNNREIEIATQQLVNTRKGRFLLDLYFPQIRLAIEVDEAHHEKYEKQDNYREQAVIDAQDVRFERIKIKGQSIEAVNARIERVVRVIKQIKKSAPQFKPFKYGQKYNAASWLKKGRLSVADDARFRTHVDVARLFGRKYKGHQRAVIRLKENQYVWFPKLYVNGDWNNQLQPGGKEIVQQKLSGGRYGGKKSESIKGTMVIVFAHHKDEFGQIYYAFKGGFEIISQHKGTTTFKRRYDVIEFDGKGGFAPKKKKRRP